MAPYSGPTYDPATGRFEFGVGAAERAVYWTLHTPGKGMEHGLIAGPRGSGKTNSLRMVCVEAMQIPHFVLMIADPLDRNGHYDTFAPIASVRARNYGKTVDLLEGAIRAIDARLHVGGFTDPDPDHPAILIGIGIDDAEAVLRNKRAAALAADIVTRGGAAGVGLVVASGSVDPADYAGNTDLLLGLAATNAFPLNRGYFDFLQSLRDTTG